MISVSGQQYFLLICCGQKLGLWLTLKSRPLNELLFPPAFCSSPVWFLSFSHSARLEDSISLLLSVRDSGLISIVFLLSNYDLCSWALVKFRYLTQRWSSCSLPIGYCWDSVRWCQVLCEGTLASVPSILLELCYNVHSLLWKWVLLFSRLECVMHFFRLEYCSPGLRSLALKL